MVNWKSKKLGDSLWLANIIAVICLINMLSANYFFRLDLTADKRYTIKDQTRELLRKLDDDVYVEVFLAGDLNPGFKRFQKNIVETLKEFEIYSRHKVHYILTNPSAAHAGKAQQEFMADLAKRGIQPTNVIDNRNGQRVEKIIFPGAIVSYGGFETPVMLLKGNKASSPEDEINQSIEGIEFEMASAINRLANPSRKKIGFLTGHGELQGADVAAFMHDLREAYDVGVVNLDQPDLSAVDVLIIAKPVRAFAPADQYHLDQYVMHGGKVMFLIDKLSADIDSASREGYVALPYDLKIDDALFHYGVRINPDLVQDQNAAFYPVVTGQVGGKSQFQLMNFPFFPLINHYPDHAITRNLDAVLLRFASSIDTVKASGISKTPLLLTSVASRKLTAPVPVNINDLRKINEQDFSGGAIPLGYLLEGAFTSVYKNRFLPDGVDQTNFKDQGTTTRLVVVGDGDIIRNEINPRTRQPQALGFDPFTQYTFANRDFLMNAIEWLTNNDGLIQTRTKLVMIRPLDREKVKEQEVTWKSLNLVLPLVLIVAYGVARAFWRKRKFASF